jgi:peptidoglycan hydrolase CwlO-like protein
MDNEQHCASQNASVMSLLVQQKKKLDVLEAECNMLRNLVLNLHKDSLSTTSNHQISINSAREDPKEEETVHQSKEAMDVDQQTSLHSMVGRRKPPASMCLVSSYVF